MAAIEKAIRIHGGKLLERVELFDVYRGAQILAGKKSVAYSLYFRRADGTLTDEEIEPSLRKIMQGLTDIGCELRS